MWLRHPAWGRCHVILLSTQMISIKGVSWLFQPMNFGVTLSMLGDPSLSVAFIKSSASTFAWGRMPTFMVEIKPASVIGVDG